MHPLLKNELGNRYGRLLVIEYVGGLFWKLKCDCGAVVIKKGIDIRRGGFTSCGCLRKELKGRWNITHGMRHSPEYKVWRAMKQRCYVKSNPSYPRYGGRGIKVCSQWLHDFKAFFASLGPRPDGMSIHRINNDGDYEPCNCKWATQEEQDNNKETSMVLVLDGIRLTQAQWAKRVGIHQTRLHQRLKAGWCLRDALYRPMRDYPRKS